MSMKIQSPLQETDGHSDTPGEFSGHKTDVQAEKGKAKGDDRVYDSGCTP